jgi:hypothetical protein
MFRRGPGVGAIPLGRAHKKKRAAERGRQGSPLCWAAGARQAQFSIVPFSIQLCGLDQSCRKSWGSSADALNGGGTPILCDTGSGFDSS